MKVEEKYYKELERNRDLIQDKKRLDRENSILKEELEQANKKIEEYSLLLAEAIKKMRGIKWNKTY